jgi:hypothetical protein
MLVQKVAVLRYVAVIEIGDSQVEQDIEKKGKIKYRKIKAIFAGSGNILHRPVDTENPEGLNQQIKKKQKSKVGNKFTLHSLVL